MPSQQNLTRQRLINAALELFATQGVTQTTTKQIAELAQVNEVTLFRHFGNKHGLLLAVIEEAAVFNSIGRALIGQADQTSDIYQVLKDYATACLVALDKVPEVVRSVVGESGQYPAENREALGRGFTQANRYVAQYFEAAINRGQLHPNLRAEKLASLLNGMLLGYAVIEFTSEFHELWQDRADFLENLVTLFLHGAVSQASQSISECGTPPYAPQPTSQLKPELMTPKTAPENVADLPANLVHQLLQQAKKQGWQDYALVYLLFAAGLSPAEMVRLDRAHYVNDAQGHFLQVTQGLVRQVPVNQWILGKRYGTSKRNPLTQWLKSRKDDEIALFINQTGVRISETELLQRWQEIAEGLLTPQGELPTLEQAQQTWCVEMLTRGMTLEQLQLLTGWDLLVLKPYAHRAKELAALKQAQNLDQQ
ncbi:transcriptional regulator, TetR family [Gloeothece citriformis PCC 7424]|uniref:Transcriptional regulator, TetR family n=1 Tax=Gloeothece citriformis (strain PCC 7424) TaxID=65393 RepID=B7KIY0_GLOC7|nr:TetR family transcriptional regulator [Gloeothece citriformis]ACK70816.1 transcriptional regulator, TetR family [Gloeothece citriformis PCC 7424]